MNREKDKKSDWSITAKPASEKKIKKAVEDLLIIEARIEIGSLIRERRKKLKITQTEISEALNMRQAQLSRIEAGEENYTIDKLLEICLYLGVKPYFKKI